MMWVHGNSGDSLGRDGKVMLGEKGAEARAGARALLPGLLTMLTKLTKNKLVTDAVSGRERAEETTPAALATQGPSPSK